jgi:hypothetical protein
MGKNPDGKKPGSRYGITPLAFIELGWVGLIAPITLAAGISRLVQWLAN